MNDMRKIMIARTTAIAACAVLALASAAPTPLVLVECDEDFTAPGDWTFIGNMGEEAGGMRISACSANTDGIEIKYGGEQQPGSVQLGGSLPYCNAEGNAYARSDGIEDVKGNVLVPCTAGN